MNRRYTARLVTVGLGVGLVLACGSDDKGSKAGGAGGASGGTGGASAGAGGTMAGTAGATGGSVSGGTGGSGGAGGSGATGGTATGGQGGAGAGGGAGGVPQQGWSLPQDISSLGESGVEPKLAVDDAGNATAVWSGLSGEVAVWASRFAAGESAWQDASPIALDVSVDSRFPLVRSMPGGDALAVYVENDNPGGDGDERLKGLLYSATGDNWGASLTIQTTGSGRVRRWRDLAVDSTGRAMALWAQDLRLWFSTYEGQFSAPARVDPSNMDVVDDVRVTFGPDGLAHAVWTMSDSDQSVRFASYDFDTQSWTTPVDLAQPSALARGSAEIAVNADGDLMVVWRRVTQNDPLEAEMGYAFRSEGSWSEGLLSPAAGGNQLYADLLMDSAGVPVVVWLRELNGQHEVLASRFEVGAWTSATTLTAAPSDDPAHPRIAAGPSGALFVVWEQAASGMTDVVANRYTGGEWQGVEPLSNEPFTNVFSTHPQTDVVVDAAGRATAVWSAGGLIQGVWYQP